MNILFDLLREPFAQRALIAGALVSVVAAMIGVILVLRRLSMLGHALGDIGFFGAALTLALGWSQHPLLGTVVPIFVVIVGAFGIMWMSQRNGSGDIVIGMTATGALALGIMLTALWQGGSGQIFSLLFGSLFAINDGLFFELTISVSLFVLAAFLLCYQRFFAIAYDTDFARTRGLAISWYNGIFSILAALIVAIGMRMMGALLISCLIIFPAITARLWVSRFSRLIWLAAGVSLLCFVIGFAVTAVTRIPAGSAIVLANIALWAGSAVCRKLLKNY
ncbi:MAG: metal ABC transporter permease [Oscillospiraceae bacterium]|nr:metal ABC transporter permease [Oscillospiraceae bacterium]